MAYMKAYNKIYYQANRNEILEKAKAYGQDMRDRAMHMERKKPKQKEGKGKKGDERGERERNKEAFTIVFDDGDA